MGIRNLPGKLFTQRLLGDKNTGKQRIKNNLHQPQQSTYIENLTCQQVRDVFRPLVFMASFPNRLEPLTLISSMKRRQFLGAALGAGALATSLPLHAREPAQKELPPVPLVQLTKDVKCSRIGFGTGMRGGMRQTNLTRIGWEKGIPLLRFAYDHGVRLFDCADLYGTHWMVAEALKDKPRDSYALVSKIWVRPGGIPEKERLGADELVPRYLKELKTDYIDVVQIHCMDKDNWSTEYAPYLEQLETLKKKGAIRAHGISSHSNIATEHASKTPWNDVVHIRINSEGMSMDGPKDDPAVCVAEAVRTAKLCKDAGQGIIAMKVIGEGRMKDDPAMRKKSAEFVKKHVDVLIVGFEEISQVEEFILNVV